MKKSKVVQAGNRAGKTAALSAAISTTKSISAVKPFFGPKRNPQYDAIVDRIPSLREGECFEVTPPAGVKASVYSNRLAGVVKRARVADGLVVRKFVTVTGTVAVTVRKKPAKAGRSK